MGDLVEAPARAEASGACINELQMALTSQREDRSGLVDTVGADAQASVPAGSAGPGSPIPKRVPKDSSRGHGTVT